MAKNKTYVVKFKRVREGKTNYTKRLKYIASNKPRIVIRKSLKNILIQSIEYNEIGDKIVDTVKSTDLRKYGWDLPTGNISSAYLTGLLFAKRAKIKEGIIDLGTLSLTKGSRLAATIKGLADGGVKINYSEEILPAEEIIKGSKLKSQNAEKKFIEVKEKIQK